jgi:hypothetical protein
MMTGYSSKKAAALDEDGMYLVHHTQPAQRPWVGLTDKEMDVIYEQHHNQYGECESPNWEYERAIEQALKDKNK